MVAATRALGFIINFVILTLIISLLFERGFILLETKKRKKKKKKKKKQKKVDAGDAARSDRRC